MTAAGSLGSVAASTGSPGLYVGSSGPVGSLTTTGSLGSMATTAGSLGSVAASAVYINRWYLGDFTKMEGTQMEMFNFLWLIWDHYLPLTPTRND